MTLTVEERLTVDELAIPCDYPEWREKLWVEYPSADECDRPAEFVVSHHYCINPNQAGTAESVVLVCKGHLETMIAVRDEAFRIAWTRGAEGMMCESCGGRSRRSTRDIQVLAVKVICWAWGVGPN
ncbi:hypothetical protein FEF26_04280 [Nesterenkonia salmonea]|uniref:Uncharacterized protein n=1 Tax=Nesterenkonia salmonea TaxID=1804987 RepID=A0A5R9BEJ8_9MICC|nr:hypothetical protein [Nesterenkonia salmonea]TLP98621.1 hypothetical protein FEF26_04280 [Nesterenkonia salmonea]